MPVGVVGVLTERHVVPALAAGNAVVLVAPDALALAERLDAAELPSGVFNLLHGAELPVHAGIDLIRPASGPATSIVFPDAEAPGTRVADEDEALRVAGDAERVSLWTRDVARAHRVAHALGAEHVWINAPAADVPDALERYCRPRTVYVP